jgi:hypothetical protein
MWRCRGFCLRWGRSTKTLVHEHADWGSDGGAVLIVMRMVSKVSPHGCAKTPVTVMSPQGYYSLSTLSFPHH